jgi:hypothetical protein
MSRLRRDDGYRKLVDEVEALTGRRLTAEEWRSHGTGLSQKTRPRPADRPIVPACSPTLLSFLVVAAPSWRSAAWPVKAPRGACLPLNWVRARRRSPR